MKHLHFISGLPRSGSTLLSAILTQHPDVHAGMSSPVASLINGCLEQIGAGSEFYSFFDEQKRKAICSALFNAHYEDNPKALKGLVQPGSAAYGIESKDSKYKT